MGDDFGRGWLIDQSPDHSIHLQGASVSFHIINKSKRYEGFNQGLGRAFSGEREMREHIKRLEEPRVVIGPDGERHEMPGMKLVEMGNENPVVTKQRGTYTFNADDIREMYNRLGDAGVPA
jgi:hypothetical protein